MNYYNEIDPKAAAWLRELIKEGLISPGEVDERSITNVKAHELTGFKQCHFFAGVGGWSSALRLAGIGDDEEVDTGSCPCQPLSSAGLHLGHVDGRHLWPAFFNILAERRPAALLGEQVASKDGREWFAGVRADLEGVGYACGAADLCAAGVGSPISRQRLFWVALANGRRLAIERSSESAGQQGASRDQPDRRGESVAASVRLAEPTGERSEARLSGPISREKGHARKPDYTSGIERARERERESGCLGGSGEQPGLEGHSGHEHDRNEPRWIAADSARSAADTGAIGAWSRCQLIDCTDGKTRRIEPESFPLAHGVPGRVGLLRGYGNAICPQLAAEFIKASLT